MREAAASFASPHTHTVPTSLHAFHFGRNTQKQPKNHPQSKRPTSYIPTGLTEEQYAQIKLADAAKLQGDLGAWGPRWKKISGDPQGNWFSMPGLWTGGYTRDTMGEKVPNWLLGDEDTVRGWRRVLLACILGLKRYGMAYLVLTLSTSYTMLYKQVSVQSIATRALLLPLLVLKPLDIIVGRISLQMAWFREYGVTKLAAILAICMSMMAIFLRQ